MNIRTLITELTQYNMDAEVSVLVDSKSLEFTINFDSAAGVAFSVTTEVTETTPCVVEEVHQPEEVNPRAALVGSNVSQGKGNWFSGTTWG